MSRRRNIDIQRAILKVLGKRGWMTAGAIARETGIELRTVKNHLYRLQRFKGKVKVLYYYPNGQLYRVAREKRFVTCHRCRAKIRICAGQYNH